MQEASHRLVVLGTGGTIAGAAATASQHVGYTAGAFAAGELVATIPALADLPLVTEDLARIDSKDLGWPLWQQLVASCTRWLALADVQGIVVTHGTDTLEETAWLLQRVLGPTKGVVLASAMRPATALSGDGPANLLDAIAVARTPGARGVLAVNAGAVLCARDVRKMHPYRLHAFGAGDAGPLGWVEEGRLRLLRAWPQEPGDAELGQRVCAAERPPRVEIVHSHAAADGRIVELLAADGVQGLVVACTGNGTVHTALERALLQAMAAGVRVVRSTRCLDGEIVDAPGAAIDATSLSPAKARVDLMLDLLG